MHSTASTTQKFTSRQISIALYAAIAAFATYASVYAYRKPFTVATFDGISFWGIPYQTLLVISQVFGYMLSKFYGIKFIAELKRLGRWKSIAVLVGFAWLMLLGFALVPPPYGMIFLFLNGFPLGLLWGIIFSYVEGRKATDFIGAAMAVSFIFSGGFSRSIAKWLMVTWNVSGQWMPFVTGLVFALPLILFIFLLEKVPMPDAEDVNERTVRLPMTKDDRRNFLKNFGLGIVVITITYLFLTIMRDVRDNFMANIWNELGYAKNASIFTKTETTTSLIVLAMMSLLVMIRKNALAFKIVHLVILGGFLLAGISSWLFISKQLDGALWMQLVGLGLYMAYIPFNCIFFERMIATFKVAGNVGFLIYIADSFGYLGSVTVMMIKEILKVQLNWSSFYSNAAIVFSIIGVIGSLCSLIYFNKKYQSSKASIHAA